MFVFKVERQNFSVHPGITIEIEIVHWILLEMDIQQEIISAAGVPGLLLDLVALHFSLQ